MVKFATMRFYIYIHLCASAQAVPAVKAGILILAIAGKIIRTQEKKSLAFNGRMIYNQYRSYRDGCGIIAEEYRQLFL